MRIRRVGRSRRTGLETIDQHRLGAEVRANRGTTVGGIGRCRIASPNVSNRSASATPRVCETVHVGTGGIFFDLPPPGSCQCCCCAKDVAWGQIPLRPPGPHHPAACAMLRLNRATIRLTMAPSVAATRSPDPTRPIPTMANFIFSCPRLTGSPRFGLDATTE